MEWLAAGFLTMVRVLLLAIATPLLEKNASKTVGARRLDVPVVFSMARVIVLAFAISTLHLEWRTGIAGWPEATLSIAIVLAMPILGALERVKPAEAVALAKAVLARFGQGQVGRAVASVAGDEPSRNHDPRDDRAGHGAGSEDELEARAASGTATAGPRIGPGLRACP
jgi:hypothetical protein